MEKQAHSALPGAASTSRMLPAHITSVHPMDLRQGPAQRCQVLVSQRQTNSQQSPGKSIVQRKMSSLNSHQLNARSLLSSRCIRTGVAWIWPEPSPAARLAAGRDALAGLPSIPNSHVGAGLLWPGGAEWGSFWELFIWSSPGQGSGLGTRHKICHWLCQTPRHKQHLPTGCQCPSLTSTLRRSTKLLGHTGPPGEEHSFPEHHPRQAVSTAFRGVVFFPGDMS